MAYNTEFRPNVNPPRNWRGVGVPGILLCALLGLCTSSAAHAQVTATELAIARRLFEEATALERAQMWSAAGTKLGEALAIKETPGLRYHLAYCEEKQGLLVEALLDYDRATELIRRGMKAPDVEAVLSASREALRARTPTLMLDLPRGLREISVEINGSAVSGTIIERPAPLNPGHHRVVIRAQGRKSFETEFEIDEGEHKTLVAFLPKDNQAARSNALPSAAESASASSPGPAPVTSRHVSATGAVPPTAGGTERSQGRGAGFTWVLVGESLVTSLALGAGIYFTVQSARSERLAEKAESEINEASGENLSVCREESPPTACKDLQAARNDAQRQSDLSIVGYAGAGVGALALIWTWLLWPADRAPQQPRLTLVPSPNGAWITATGHF